MYIFTGPGLASYRRRPLSSNVRRRRATMPVLAAFKSASAGRARRHGIGATSGNSANGTQASSPSKRQASLPESHGRRPRSKAWSSNPCSAERDASVALKAQGSERASLLYRRRASSCGSFKPATRRLKRQRQSVALAIPSVPWLRVQVHGPFGRQSHVSPHPTYNDA